MKKTIRKWLIIFFIVLLSMPGMTVNAAEDMEIEQVIAKMPGIELYVRNEEQPDADNLEVWLEDELLTINSIQLYGEKDAATDFFILVDVSNSIPDSYCKEIKNALTEFMDAVEEKDNVVLVSFGEEVTTLLKGKENTEERKEAITKLHNNDNKTLLFEALMQTADISDKLKSDNRKVVIVISDGEDFAVGTSTGQESKEALAKRNMPVYAMGIRNTAKENLNSFGEFARSLGGNLEIFSSSEAASTLMKIRTEISNTWAISLSADSNCVNNQMNMLSMNVLSTGISRNKEVMLKNYVEDKVSPEIVNVEKTESNELKITFSENVIGADLATSWNIEFAEKSLPVVTAVYEEGCVAVITFEEDLYSGTYYINAPGVTDVSMEKNSTSETYEAEIEGVIPEPKWIGFIKEWVWLICIVIVVIFVLVVFLVWQKIKKNKGIVYVDGKVSLANNISQRQRVTFSEETGFNISLEILSGSLSEGEIIKATIFKSMIVGRASFCDLSLEDSRLSRQHFALEHKEGNVYITDLQTTNGTFVNGVWIHNEHKLENEDVIVAGSLKMKISW